MRSAVSGRRTRYSTGLWVSGSRNTPMWPTRADGTSSSRPSLMPMPARRIGTIASFLPAMTGASMVTSGVSILRVVSGRSRVIS